MAKKSDHLAGFDDENTGGLLSGFLADEDTFDRRALWRLGSWAVAAVAAVVVAVMANQAHLGLRREKMATLDLVQQANRLQAATRESQNEARRLGAAVDTLNGDRDRLYSRVTVLEQGLDSVTGTIAKGVTAPAQQAAGSAAPAVAQVASTVAAASPNKAAPQTEPAPANVSTIVKDVTTKPAATPTTPLVEAKSMMAPPDPAAGKLIEPQRPASPVTASPVTAEPILPVMAAAPASESSEAESAAAAVEASLPTSVRRTEFGVDLGSANSIPGLRALWRGLLKSRANAPLAALQPIIVIRESTGGRGMQLRLVAGPLGDAAAAAKLCAVLSDNDRDCATAVYEGQRLTLKAEETPAPAKPAAAPARQKNSAKRAALEAPKQPETRWTIFGRRTVQ